MSVAAMPATVVDTGSLPVMFTAPAAVAAVVPPVEPVRNKHHWDNPNAVSVVALGVTRCMRGPRAHSAAQVGQRGWRVATR